MQLYTSNVHGPSLVKKQHDYKADKVIVYDCFSCINKLSSWLVEYWWPGRHLEIVPPSFIQYVEFTEQKSGCYRRIVIKTKYFTAVLYLSLSLDCVDLDFHFEAGGGILQLRSDIVLKNVPKINMNLIEDS